MRKADWSVPHLSLQALKVLRTAEFAPFVVFIAAPSMATLAELKSSINVSPFLTPYISLKSLYSSLSLCLSLLSLSI